MAFAAAKLSRSRAARSSRPERNSDMSKPVRLASTHPTIQNLCAKVLAASNRKYVTGDRLTLADFSLGATMNFPKGVWPVDMSTGQTPFGKFMVAPSEKSASVSRSPVTYFLFDAASTLAQRF